MGGHRVHTGAERQCQVVVTQLTPLGQIEVFTFQLRGGQQPGQDGGGRHTQV